MSRNKILLPLMALMLMVLPCASVCAQASEVIDADAIKADEANYKTSVVEIGELGRTMTTSVSEYYPLVTTVRYRGDTAEFVESLVKRGEEVKAGTHLVRIRVLYDSVAAAQQELQYERSRESYVSGCAERRQAIQSATYALDGITDPYARQIAEYKLEKQKIQLEQYIYQQEKSLEKQKTDLEEMNARHAIEYIDAPCDGIVSDLQYNSEGTRIYDGTMICTISDESVLLLYSTAEDLRYGMNVTVSCGANKSRQDFAAHVVAAANCIPDATSNKVLIQLDEYPEDGKVSRINPKVAYDKIYLSNVLVADRRSVTMNGGKNVITKLSEDGTTHRRYATVPFYVLDKVIFLQGVEAGEVLILD